MVVCLSRWFYSDVVLAGDWGCIFYIGSTSCILSLKNSGLELLNRKEYYNWSGNDNKCTQ